MGDGIGKEVQLVDKDGRACWGTVTSQPAQWQRLNSTNMGSCLIMSEDLLTVVASVLLRLDKLNPAASLSLETEPPDQLRGLSGEHGPDDKCHGR